MFRKNKESEASVAAKSAVSAGEEKGALMLDKTVSAEDKSSNTVIASGVRFEGNINANGQIYVYGTIVGNIESQEGIVKIMRNGLVEGNIHSRELIVDGGVKGLCRAESVDICENGRVEGTLTYGALSIKKGGLFTGQAEVLPHPENAVNVVDLIPGAMPALITSENVSDADGQKTVTTECP